MNETIELQGRHWHPQQIQEIGQWVSQNPTWSRYRLSRELCTRLDWIRPNGQMADMAARSFLNKLHERALIQLPPCRRASPNRMKHRQLECVAVDSDPVEGELGQLGALHLYEVSRDRLRRGVFESLLAREHYLGYRSPVGENLKYLLCTQQDRPLAAWLFGAAAWRCEARLGLEPCSIDARPNAGGRTAASWTRNDEPSPRTVMTSAANCGQLKHDHG